jgi:predicted membrane channel-forming protein YqfA (hemolysin III family)
LGAVFLAIGGIGLIVLTHLLFEENLTLKFTFLLTGAILISAAHFINRRLCRACTICQA